MRQTAQQPGKNPTRQPWCVLSRTLAGGIGGYALAQVLPVALVAPWGLPRADAVLAAMLLGILVYAIAFMAAFTAVSAGRAWRNLAWWVLVSGGAAWWLL